MDQTMVSILVVNYNAGPFLAECLRSLPQAFQGADGQQTPIEILVADNQSTDDSLTMARAAAPTAQYFEMGENLGFGKAMNRLANEAKSPWLFILNPDASLEGNAWFEALQRFVLAHPRTGVMGPNIKNSDGSFQPACIRGEPTPWNSFCHLSGLSSRFPNSKIFAGYNLTYLDRRQPQQVHSVSGSALFIRRQVFQKIGGFDEQFFLFAEDLDLCRRAAGEGFEVWYNPTLLMTHHKGKCSTTRPAFVKYHFYLSMALYFDKYYNKGLGKILRPLVWWTTAKIAPRPQT